MVVSVNTHCQSENYSYNCNMSMTGLNPNSQRVRQKCGMKFYLLHEVGQLLFSGVE